LERLLLVGLRGAIGREDQHSNRNLGAAFFWFALEGSDWSFKMLPYQTQRCVPLSLNCCLSYDVASASAVHPAFIIGGNHLPAAGDEGDAAHVLPYQQGHRCVPGRDTLLVLAASSTAFVLSFLEQKSLSVSREIEALSLNATQFHTLILSPIPIMFTSPENAWS
jgi:hypothetical protein